MAGIEESQNEAIYPLMHPDYWDGHSLGYGSFTMSTSEYTDLYGGRKFVQKTLEDYLNQSAPRFTLEKFDEPGQVFDPNETDYEPGAVIFGIQECLVRQKRRFKVDDTFVQQHTSAERQHPTLPATGRYQGELVTFRSAEKNAWYGQYYLWGVVIEAKPGQKSLALVREHNVLKWKNQLVVPKLRLVGMRALEIDKTEHLGKPRLGLERLERLLALEICTQGTPGRTPTTLLDWVVKLAQRPAF